MWRATTINNNHFATRKFQKILLRWPTSRDGKSMSQELKSLDLEANVVTYSAALSTSDFWGSMSWWWFSMENMQKLSEILKQKMDLHRQKGHLETLDLPIFWASELPIWFSFNCTAKCIDFIGICCFKGVNFSIAILSDKSLALGLHLIHWTTFNSSHLTWLRMVSTPFITLQSRTSIPCRI